LSDVLEGAYYSQTLLNGMEALQNYQAPRSSILLPRHATEAKENNRACMERYVNKNKIMAH
jgi:hypothetical protein